MNYDHQVLAGSGRTNTYLAVPCTVCLVGVPAVAAFFSACFEIIEYLVVWFANTICFRTSKFPYLLKTTSVLFAGVWDELVSVWIQP